jgi:glycosyltransferase involved in cell wall biosynthesis
VHRGTWHSVDRYLALTDGIAAHLRDYGVPAERITVKPNALPDPGPPPAQPGEGFLYAARLTPEKGLGLLLDAWRAHGDGELGPLRVAGDGPLRALAETAAAERADVTYLGPLDAAAMREEIRRTACVVVASRWDDVLPTIVIEALAGGRPVLGTAMGGIPYLVGDCGWLVEPEPAALAAGLKLARDGAAALAGPARARYVDSFSPDLLTRRLIEVYAEVARS